MKDSDLPEGFACAFLFVLGAVSIVGAGLLAALL